MGAISAVDQSAASSYYLGEEKLLGQHFLIFPDFTIAVKSVKRYIEPIKKL
jgi:hypothetical protein